MSERAKIALQISQMVARELTPDCAALGGALLVVHGVDLIYRPAAFIIGGAMSLLAAWRYARSAD